METVSPTQHRLPSQLPYYLGDAKLSVYRLQASCKDCMTPSLLAPHRPQALSILLKASSLLLDAGSEEELLSQTLDFASTLLTADAYGVWRQMDDDNTWRVVAQRGLSDAYPRSVNMSPAISAQSVWTMEDILADTRSPFNRSVYLEEGIRSAMVIPWTPRRLRQRGHHLLLPAAAPLHPGRHRLRRRALQSLRLRAQPAGAAPAEPA